MGYLEAVGGAARAARERAGLTQLDIASAAKLSTGAVSRFETTGRARELERLVAVYEDELGLGRDELWCRALARRAKTR